MTEEERKKWREYKAEVVRSIKSMDYYHERYGERLSFEPRLLAYTDGVLSHPDDHNLYEILGVLRFFRMLDKYTFKEKEVRKFYRFYEALKFSGVNGRRHYKLTPVQCFQFANIYGFYRWVPISEEIDKNGSDFGQKESKTAKNVGKRSGKSEGLQNFFQERRVTRTAYIFVPRKFSKTTQAAAMAVYDLLCGDDNSQAYIGANSYNQAKICFDEIRKLIWGIDNTGKHFRVNREKITFIDHHKDGLIECLAANAKTKDGLFASLVIMDEYAQARDTANRSGADLKNVLTSSMGPRKNPLTVIITTASDVVDGPFHHELESVEKVLRGEEENDSLFASLFMPDADDDEGDPRTWRKVQPHMGITVQPDFYENEWRDAQLSAENMLAFRTKMLNVFTINDKKTWFTYEKARELIGDFDIYRMSGVPQCAVAFDLSVHDDFSAVSYTFYSSETKCFYCHTDYYFPEGALKGHPNEELYRRWHDEGYLKFCKGDKIDVAQITEDILRRAKKINIIRIGYDAYKAQQLVSILSSVGARNVLTPYSQTYGSFNLPVESFEMLAYDDPPKIVMNDNPINVFCLTNCVIDMDHLENKKPLKVSQYRKIDGTITCLMTLGLLYSYER